MLKTDAHQRFFSVDGGRFTLLCKQLFKNNCTTFNFFTDDKFCDWSKLRAFADDKTNVNQNLKFALERVENMMVRGDIHSMRCLLLYKHSITLYQTTKF